MDNPNNSSTMISVKDFNVRYAMDMATPFKLILHEIDKIGKFEIKKKKKIDK